MTRTRSAVASRHTPGCRAETVRRGKRPGGRRRAVFLDRDGVLIADVDHLRSVEQIRILPRVPQALARLRAAGWTLVIATNQSVVARGWITEARLGEIHRALLDQLRARGAEIDAVYYCPHHPDGAVDPYRRACDCRKPSPGMLLRAAGEHHLDLAASVVVGDAPSDIEAGRRAGCRTVLIRGAGGGGDERSPAGVPERRAAAPERRAGARKTGGATSASAAVPDYVARDLWDAAGWVLRGG